ncbi:GCN5-related N-acetyltransferase [Dinoroseobacter shibae DFL 12 = DSM 16493]|jgi:RimJ/RimL family protein N-acetyltransferase|uniref:GCN5-related N-acetyltransferase n=1 Tax=Dinoroseobacter shibae (strain DSM 16493 / NCIMB 14021 / DFL 12) TaxID=398580 RepID=A8LK08_DINSH|nr:GNAT family N-acetyltransferase [Dinoroseobacter shibae]ABV93207.1 GCN5-related N-acetyltransferase [Dinoroseobacter shibae DFL 12 = DSM 16493]URF48127.1 GNAT family N-acetyltransferase [Dinoroseobacter shibae]URF52437.1 GNAT family N-acetyltransferase [Dinoroseobacter shibae]
MTGPLPELRTARLHLRPLAPGDAAALARIAGHPKVAPNIFVATIPWPEVEAAALIARDTWRGTLGFRLAICLPEGRMIGSIGVSRQPHIFYFLDPDSWGRGYAREAVRAFADAVQTRFDLPVLGAEVFTDNPASGKVLKACGFARTGQSMATSRARLEPAPVFLYERRQPEKALS